MSENTSPEVIEVDPSTLLLANNVRTDTHPDAKEFAQSIKTRGVIEVITAYRTDDGNLMVLRGQRRTLVAAQVGTPTGTVPVRVVPAPDETDRIVDQLIENVHRAPMRDAEVVTAVNQLSLLGVSPAQIAKQVALPRKEVDTALTVAATDAARDRLSAGMTLDEAAMFAEFADDADALAALDRAVSENRDLTHVAAYLRDTADERHALRAHIDTLRAAGLPVLDPHDVPRSLWGHTVMGRINKSTGERITEENAHTLPGAAVVVTVHRADQYAYDDDFEDDDFEDDDFEDGESGDADSEHSADDEDPQQAAEDGPQWRFTTQWIVTDPTAVDLAQGWEVTPDAKPDLSEAEREARREERRRVIANNKEWTAAEGVRRDWLTTFAARKTPPTGAEQFIATCLTTRPYWLNGIHEFGTASILGLGPEQPATAKRATMLTLGLILAAWEKSLDKHSWRSPSSENARVLDALTEWGYRPSDVELLMKPTDAAAA